MNIENWFLLKSGFDVLKDENGTPLPKDKWIESQIKRLEGNNRVIKLSIDILPNDIIY